MNGSGDLALPQKVDVPKSFSVSLRTITVLMRFEAMTVIKMS